jgi:ATP-dependent Clp protease protease subunit
MNIYLTGELTRESIAAVVEKLCDYESVDGRKEVTIYLNSEGGDIEAALGLVDIMQSTNLEVTVKAYGICMSAAFVVLAGGDLRECGENCTLMFHSISGTHFEGSTDQVAEDLKQLAWLEGQAVKFLENNTTQPGKYWQEILNSKVDCYFTPQDAVADGVIERIF